MQETHVVAHYGGFADDYVGGVVYEKPVADFGGRVEIHAELAADDVLEHLGREPPVFFPEHMGYAVGLQTLKALEKQQGLQIPCAGGVTQHGGA